MNLPNPTELMSDFIDPAKADETMSVADLPLACIRGLDDEQAKLIEKALGVSTVGQFASDPRVATIMVLASTLPGLLGVSGDLRNSTGEQLALSHLAWLLGRPLAFNDRPDTGEGEVRNRVTD